MKKKKMSIPMGVPIGNIHPPAVNSNLTKTHKFRFLTSGNAINDPVTGLDLLTVCGVIAASTSAAYAIQNSVRLKRLTFWGASPTYSSFGAPLPSRISVLWQNNASLNSAFNTELEKSDISTSTAYPAYLSMAPPRGSLAAQWLSPISTSAPGTLFQLSCNVGSILELEIEMVQQDGTGLTLSIVNVATAGTVGYTRCDKFAGTNVFDPVALTLIG
jgi:hypothetical protein